MFGFGMSQRDKWHLNQAEILVAPVAKMMGQDGKTMARQLFDSIKAEVVKDMGENAYAENMGDRLVANKKDVLEKRLAAGLTIDDIRRYWNQTPLMLNLQYKLLEMPDYMELDIARQMGKSMDEMQAIPAGWRKSKPRWGDPEQWNPALPVNEGFTPEDADLYIEFYLRVSRWQERTPESEQKAMLVNYNSYNAMLRDLIRKGAI